MKELLRPPKPPTLTPGESDFRSLLGPRTFALWMLFDTLRLWRFACSGFVCSHQYVDVFAYDGLGGSQCLYTQRMRHYDWTLSFRDLAARSSSSSSSDDNNDNIDS